MSSSVPERVWASFTQDPRWRSSAELRASDQDREVVLSVLGEAFADGRLDKEEYDDRAGRAAVAKTLGELPELIADLVPQVSPRRPGPLAVASPEDLRKRAVLRFEAQRRHALSSFLVASLVCWAIWSIGLLSGHVGFPWPLFVMLGTGLHGLRVLTHREVIVTEEQRRLERKQRRALGSRRPGGWD